MNKVEVILVSEEPSLRTAFGSLVKKFEMVLEGLNHFEGHLTKSTDMVELKRAITKYKELTQYSFQSGYSHETSEKNRRLSIATQEGLEIAKVKDILYCESSG